MAGLVDTSDQPEHHDDANALQTIETVQSAPGQPITPIASNATNRLAVPGSSPLRRSRSSSIRIRRLPSSNRSSILSDRSSNPDLRGEPGVVARDHAQEDGEQPTGRRRSMSAPERREEVESPDAAEADARHASRFMPIIPEGRTTPMLSLPDEDEAPSPTSPTSPTSSPSSPARPTRPPLFGRLRSGYRSADFGAAKGEALTRVPTAPAAPQRHEYDDEVANLLDVVDPEVSTLSTLTNMQNSLFIPHLGRFVNRRPTYELTTHPSSSTDTSDEFIIDAQTIAAAEYELERRATRGTIGHDDTMVQRRLARSRVGSITSRLSESRYAVLPHGVDLSSWSHEDKEALEDHVRHMLHSRRSKMKRGWKGFLKYIRRPLGFFVTLYAFCITIFGLIWVLFLIGWISGGSTARHKYLINVIDNVLVALFAVMGDGLAPFRAVDTYHMIFIAHYARLTWKKRKADRLPKLDNRNDLPTATEFDVENVEDKDQALSVLSPKQQRRLAHHQKKFARSHTFYKPHETTTHYAFSIRLLITIVVLLDMHSLLQISLGSVTWGWNYHTRPAVITTVILCCSITANTVAGVLISVGDRRSRKTEVVEQIFRQQLTEEAIKKVERHKRERAMKEGEERQPLSPVGERDHDKEVPQNTKAYEGA